MFWLRIISAVKGELLGGDNYNVMREKYQTTKKKAPMGAFLSRIHCELFHASDSTFVTSYFHVDFLEYYVVFSSDFVARSND